MEGTWRKGPELTALRAQLTELDRKIQLSLKPIEQGEEMQENGQSVGEKSAVESPRQPIPNKEQQPYVPSRLQQIANASGGRIVIGRIPSHRNDYSSFKKMKI